MSVSNLKADNQYFGKYFERAIVEYINKNNCNIDPNQYEDLKGYSFNQNELNELNQEASSVAKYLKFNNNIKAEYVGNHTEKACGDILLNSTTSIEIKRILTSGSGTYHNTSIFFLKEYGFDFKEYMKKYNLYDTIRKYFPLITVSETNNSPVNQKNSSLIRHSDNEEGKKAICQKDEEIRKIFIQDLTTYFKENPDLAYDFAKNMLNKVKLRTKNSYKPDRFIVYRYDKKLISEINLQDISLNTDIENTDFGLIIGPLRMQIGWQNGNGLNNPTIRIFFR